jgi:hypothetical protein
LVDDRIHLCAKWWTASAAMPTGKQESAKQEVAMPGMQMGGAGVDRTPALARVGPQRGRLRDALTQFQDAAASDDRGRAEWIAAVVSALTGLGDAWQEHVDFTEAPNGLFDDLLDDSVEVAPEIDHLRRDHEVVASAMARAGELLATDEAGPHDTKLVQSLAGVAKQVEQHRRRGADLLYQVYSVDLSAGD